MEPIIANRQKYS